MSTAVVVVAFGVAFGYVEAAVVVYLRAALGIMPAAVPAYEPATFGTFEAVEIARELATLVMIASVGWLAGRTRIERLAWAAVVFGAWDIVYYLGLWLAIGWPPTLDTWDVLFLVPMPWVGPVWAPVLVSAALVGFGLTAAWRLRASASVEPGQVRWLAAIAGGALVVLSFVVDTNSVLAGDSSPWTGWPVFWAGIALATAATVSALVGRSTAPAPPGVRLQHGSGRGPSVSSPDWSTHPPTQEVTEMTDTVKDPVCGMEFRPENAAATAEHEGRTFYFCSQSCHETFVNDPHRYAHLADEHGGHAGH